MSSATHQVQQACFQDDQKLKESTSFILQSFSSRPELEDIVVESSQLTVGFQVGPCLQFHGPYEFAVIFVAWLASDLHLSLIRARIYNSQTPSKAMLKSSAPVLLNTTT